MGRSNKLDLQEHNYPNDPKAFGIYSNKIYTKLLLKLKFQRDSLVI